MTWHPGTSDNVDQNFVDYRNQLMAILNQESSLMEIVKLIGSDVLPDDQKLTLEIARVIRLGFLQQNAFHKDDTCVPMEKQFLMMDMILYLYKKAQSAGHHGYADVRSERGATFLTASFPSNTMFQMTSLDMFDDYHKDSRCVSMTKYLKRTLKEETEMSIEYLGLSEINGPLVVLEGVQNASFEEIVEIAVDDNEKKLGRIVELYEDKAVIQVFEGTEGMSLEKYPHQADRTSDGACRFTGHPRPYLQRYRSADRRSGRYLSGSNINVNGLPLNPVTREYPRNYIRTGISAIDGLTTLIRGQKLPIFSGNGLPHDQLAAQIVQQASLGDDSDEKLCNRFCSYGC